MPRIEVPKNCWLCKYAGVSSTVPPCSTCTAYDRFIIKGAVDRAAHDATAGDKLPLQHLPYEALEECAKIMRAATVKYPYNNWRKGAPYMEFTGSILRHVWAFMCGADKDPESGFHPLAHAALDCLFIVTWALQGKGEDDRVKP